MKPISPYADIKRYKPIAAATMQESPDGRWISLSDYERLLRELRWERLRLRRAAGLVHSLLTLAHYYSRRRTR